MAETLGKIISQAAFLSRRNAVTAIKSGRVRINGKVCMNPAERIESGMKIAFDRRPLEIPDLNEKWYAMNAIGGSYAGMITVSFSFFIRSPPYTAH